MERPTQGRLNTQIYEEACEWFIECRAGDLDDAARADFDRWLRKSPDHQSAYLEIAAIWNEGPELDPSNRWRLETLISEAAADCTNVIQLTRAPAPTDNTAPRQSGIPLSTPATSFVNRRRRPLAITAAVLLLTVGIAGYLVAPVGVYATGRGEQRSLALNDGSTVELNSLSKIRIRYNDHDRFVDLLEGQALFRVAKDVTRPFVVYSGRTRVRAIGTQFDVYRKTNDTVITVVEGRVAVQSAQDNSATVAPGTDPVPRQSAVDANSTNAAHGDALALSGDILLAAGEQITLTSGAARRIPHANLASATAWTQRQLVFNSASLTEVADEFNRYNERKLVIDPSALRTSHISGIFSSTDPASLIRFLRDRPGLHITETPTEIRVDKEP